MADAFRELFCLSAFILLTTGSVIEFQGSVEEIQSSLTDELTLRCSLNDTGSKDGAIIGRRDVTETTTNIQHVTSLVIVRDDGVHVASVSQFQPAMSLSDNETIKVTGDVSGKPGERGFIELTWEFPTEDQAGHYMCEVNAVDDLSHNVVFSKELEIGVRQPTLEDLISHIHDLKVDNSLLKGQVGNLTSTVHSLEVANDITRTQLIQMQRLMNQENPDYHVETGSFDCQKEGGWHQTGSFYQGRVSHTFTKPYKSAPVVHLTIAHLDFVFFPNMGTNQDHSLHVSSVTSHMFTADCVVWQDMNVADFEVSWIAMPTS